MVSGNWHAFNNICLQMFFKKRTPCVINWQVFFFLDNYGTVYHHVFSLLIFTGGFFVDYWTFITLFSITYWVLLLRNWIDRRWSMSGRRRPRSSCGSSKRKRRKSRGGRRPSGFRRSRKPCWRGSCRNHSKAKKHRALKDDFTIDMKLARVNPL